MVNVGIYDISSEQSELLECHFTHLLNFLKKCIFVSGPIHLYCHRLNYVSTLLGLQSVFSSLDMIFIEQFNLFWNCSLFYNSDGIHPSVSCVHTLVANISHVVQITPSD